MKHGHFTTGDIFDAMQSAGLIGTVYDFRQFLAALPDHDDEWEECTFHQIQKGDRVKKVVMNEGVTETFEGVAAAQLGKYTRSWVNDQRHLIFDNYECSVSDTRYYRIPKKVVQPDPAEHPVILDPHTTDDEVFDYAVWDAEDFYLCYTHEGEFMRGAEPSEITKFTPAKVVAEDDR